MKHNTSNKVPILLTLLITVVCVSISYAELPDGEVWTPPPKPVVKKPIIKEPVEPVKSKPQPVKVIKPIVKKYGLFVDTIPKNATIKITDIVPIYRQGIKLKPRSYRLKISKSGYQTVTKTIRIRKQDLHIKISLKKAKKREDKKRAEAWKAQQKVKQEQAVAKQRAEEQDAKQHQLKLKALVKKRKQEWDDKQRQLEEKKIADAKRKQWESQRLVAEKNKKRQQAAQRKKKVAVHVTVRIPAGSFTMGCVSSRDNVEGGCRNSEKPPRLVKVAAFSMMKYEVTVAQYLQCVKAKGCSAPEWQQAGSQYNIKTGRDNHYKKMGTSLRGGNYPIVGISWNDASAYARWLRRATGKSWRLPSEAEWEYAARGGDNSKAYPWGNRASHHQANYGKNTCCDGAKSGKDQWFYTAPVGRFPVNGYGLHDMHGNVWEWVQDKWHYNYKNAPKNAFAWQSGKGANRVIRGGSWSNAPWGLRSANRSGSTPDYRINDLGFRLARSKTK